MSRLPTLTWAFVGVIVAMLLTIAGPTEGKDVRYDPQTVYFTYCFSHPPAARIASGDKVITRTRDASNDSFRPTHKKIADGNLDLSRVTAAEYIADIERNEPIVARFAGGPRYFRYAYLHEGDTLDKRNAVRHWLLAHGFPLAQGIADVQNWVWKDAHAPGEAREDWVVGPGVGVVVRVRYGVHVGLRQGACGNAVACAVPLVQRVVARVP